MSIPILTELTECAVRRRLIDRGFVLVTDRMRDPASCHTVFRLSNGVIVRVSDQDAAEGPATVYRDRCAAAGALVGENLERLIEMVTSGEMP